ncbi:MAG: neutral/alkaline non-lysosomal ceramidase N-terminal domain-containing protein [Gemmataceae bacterium]|jgi:hypothetical protein|nr:neutral/alkaline non-lysosomal ceramidase N-terminal domain-containing protein [Gemmataceae bacterium]
MRILSLFILGLICPPLLDAGEFKAGVAKKVITPEGPLWMSGYASRNKPCEAKQHDLYIKALALEDERGERFLFVTADLCGVPIQFTNQVWELLKKEPKLSRAGFVFACSHTHSGPVIDGNLTDMFAFTEGQPEKIKQYTKDLIVKTADLCREALKDLAPAQLSHGTGKARFVINRREAKGGNIVLGVNPEGPTDPSVPVLKVERDGKLIAIVFGYACHNTTLSGYEWSGDYAGFAQIELEQKHKGAIALFWSGCGADANPHPRGTRELAEKHGKELAEAVTDTLKGKLAPLPTRIDAQFAELTLPLSEIPSKEKWSADLLTKNLAQKKRAEKMLKILEAGQKIPAEYMGYPVHVWKFGDQLHWVSLGGEVVVDYALKIKKDAKTPVWITAYADDVPAYIPSARILNEGGYEADFSMIYYGLPSKWSPKIEEIILNQVAKMLK